MSKPWSHLPSAALIDRVIAAVGANTETTWDAAWDAARDAAEAAWDAARDAAWDAARDAARDAAWDAAGFTMARDAVWDAVLALVVWDDCAHLLDTDPEQVRVLALLGHHPAVLLLPAVIALNKSIAYSA